jgi:Caspase domain
MPNNSIFKPLYDASWALAIGINRYKLTPPLNYARNDAESFAELLRNTFGFPDKSVSVLLDEDATREQILTQFLAFTANTVGPDDRVVVFFAGHGCTRRGRRGEVGFLVPVDGKPDNLSTLVRWDELTSNAELIPAKHVLFVMDACYGGLAIHRNTPPGSARFLNDMLQRYSRQVLTAGKADELVADSGGSRPDHSIFTGYLLDALEGKAADSNDIISANAVMAYVYDHVSKDPRSRQSPHFGFLDGDGDFIFSKLQIPEEKEKGEDSDLLVQVPAGAVVSSGIVDIRSLIELVKEYVSEPRNRIRLDDLVSSEIRAAAYDIREDEFPLQTSDVTADAIAQRLRKYEALLSRLSAITILLARWGGVEHQPLIERIVARLSDGTEPRSGRSVWLGMRWYPVLRLLYAGGISAVSSHNYESLYSLLTTRIKGNKSGLPTEPAVVTIVEEILELDRMDMFKVLPSYENVFAPRSEYLFKSVQPELEDILFFGKSYEDAFDRFEILYALTYVDLQTRLVGQVWAPPGRFGWKERHGYSAYNSLLDEARTKGNRWEPLAAGFFGGSIDRFEKNAAAFRDSVLSNINRW